MIQLKSPKDIEGIRKSGKLLARLFEEIGPQIQAGIRSFPEGIPPAASDGSPVKSPAVQTASLK